MRTTGLRRVAALLVSVLVVSLVATAPAAGGPGGRAGRAAHAPSAAATGPVAACTATFSDVPCDHPFFHEIDHLAGRAVVTGHPDGTFRPTTPVTRQETAALLHRAAGRPTGPFDPIPYTDVDATNPFHDAIAWATDIGLAGGHPDGTFRPTTPVTRQEAAALLFRGELIHTIDADTAHRCEILDPTECLLPFPSDHFTVADAAVDRPIGTSGTGLRVDLDPASMPTDDDGVPVDPTAFNMNDGFSPGQLIVTRVPGVDLVASGAPLITDLDRSLESDSPIVLLDADTGERVPVFAELDANATSPDDQTLLIRPLRNLLEGHRHVVALRGLVDGDGHLIEPSLPFEVYRDGVGTLVPAVEDRRDEMEDVFAALAAAGIPRDDLHLAWDFTVASEANLSERLLHMRDDAFAQLGTDAPGFTVEQVDGSVNEHIATRVRGTFEVPRYLEGDGATGATMAYGPDGLPERNGTQTANFDCIVPHAASAESPARISLFGHGLLGSADGVLGFAEVADEHNTVFCGTDWIGMAEEDLVTVAGILTDLSKFSTIPDRAQQGILNFLFLGRLMLHPQGFAGHPAFQDEGEPLLDRSELVYIGGSQGGIMGGALTAVAQDFTKAVLAVPGMNYSTMLRRSSNWPTFELIMQSAYDDELDQTLGISMIQMLWDRGESNGYAHHLTGLTGAPYPGTPAHRVLLFEAFGDFQVANVATETMARTLGVSLRSPALAPGRSPIADQFWGIPVIGSYPFDGSALVVWDWGTAAPPLENTPPQIGKDPHGRVGDDHETVAQSMLTTFVETGTLVDVCGGQPCTSPP